MIFVQALCLFLILCVLFLFMWKKEKKVFYYEYDIVELFEEEPHPPKCKVAIALLMRRPVDLPIWFKHHRKLGVSHFFIRLEDSPGWEDYLATQTDVTYEISNSDKAGNNYETLMHRQLAFVNMSLGKAHQMGIDWVFHIDSDELLHGSLAVLDELAPQDKCVRIDNAEAVFKEDDNTCFSAVKFLKCSSGAPCRSYVNGKSGGRAVEGVRLQGPHHFSFNGEIHGENIKEVPFSRLHVLHFDSCSFGAWAEKFKHLSKQKKDNVPFPYYNQSMEAATKAYDIYKEHNMKTLDGVPEEIVYDINNPLF